MAQAKWHKPEASLLFEGLFSFFNIIASCASHQWKSSVEAPAPLSERGNQVKNTNRSDMTHSELLLHLSRTAMDEDS